MNHPHHHTQSNDRLDELKKRIDKWFSTNNNEEILIQWTQDYLRRRPIQGSDSLLLNTTKQGIINYLASCNNEPEVDNLIKKMKGAWRIHKRRKQLINVSIFLHSKDYKRLKSICNDTSNTPSVVIGNLLTNTYDNYKQIRQEERLAYAKRERELIEEHELKIKALEFKTNIKLATHESNLSIEHKKLVTAIKELKMIAESIIMDPPLVGDIDGPTATEYIKQISQCTKAVSKYIEPQIEIKTKS